MPSETPRCISGCATAGILSRAAGAAGVTVAGRVYAADMDEPASPALSGRGIAVAAPNDLAARAGVDVALDGGNAVDAAVAAAVTTMVTELGLVSLSAGGYVAIQPSHGDPVTVDGGVEMPGRGLASHRFGEGLWDVTTPYAGGTTMTIGPGTVATPGALKALDEAWRMHGSLPWERLLEPAVEAAAGFPHGSASFYYLSYVHEQIFGWHPESIAAFHTPDGAVIPVGDAGRGPPPGRHGAAAGAGGGGRAVRGRPGGPRGAARRGDRRHPVACRPEPPTRRW